MSLQDLSQAEGRTAYAAQRSHVASGDNPEADRLASALREREEILARQLAPIAPRDPWEVTRTKAERAI